MLRQVKHNEQKWVRSQVLALMYFPGTISSPLNFPKKRGVNSPSAGSQPVAQFAALDGSRRVDGSLFILSIISV